MKRPRLVCTIGLLVLLYQSTSKAQPDHLIPLLFKEPPPPAVPMQYGMFSVLGAAHSNELDLVEEQRKVLRELLDEYRQQLRDLTAEKNAKIEQLFEEKEQVSMTELAALEEPKLVAAREGLRDEFTAKAKEVLLPHQLELAADLVLVGRLKRYGLAGLLTSDELRTTLNTPTKEVVETVIERQETETAKEIEALIREYRKAQAKFREKLIELRRRQLDDALESLGEDGLKLRAVLDRLEDVK